MFYSQWLTRPEGRRGQFPGLFQVVLIQNKGGTWPSTYTMMPATMPSHVYRTWGKSERMWAREPDHHHLG